MIRPRYRIPGDSSSPARFDLAFGRSPVLRRSDHFRIKYDANLAAQKIEQHSNALIVIHPIEQTESSLEDTLDHANLVTRGKAVSEVEPHEAAFILARSQLRDHLLRNSCRFVAMTNEATDPDG